MKQPILGNLNPFTRILFFIILVITSMLVIFMTGFFLVMPFFGISMAEAMALMADYSDPDAIVLLKYFQILQELGLFLIPAVVAGFLFSGSAFVYLRMDIASRPVIWVLTLLVMVVSIPFFEWMITVNEAMTLPSWLGGLERWMKETEAQAAGLTEAFLNVTTTGGFLVNFLMIAILPAIGEEFLFRGILQRLLHDWFRNIHVAILVAAILFGTMHLQFYGVFPRIFYGIVFGYLFYWSGSIWIPVFAHFINNGVAITVSFLEKSGYLPAGTDSFGMSGNGWIILGSLIFSLFSLYLIFRKGFFYQQSHFPGESRKISRSSRE